VLDEINIRIYNKYTCDKQKGQQRDVLRFNDTVMF